MAAVPSARGLVLCLSSHEDFATGRLTLADCFTELTVRVFPAAGPAFWAVAFLSDGEGSLTGQVVVTHLADGRVIDTRNLPVGLPDRLAVIGVRHQVTPYVLPGPGTYEVRLVVAGEPVADATFVARAEEPAHE